MIHYKPQEYDFGKLSEQDSVCVCTMQWQWDATDDSESRVPDIIWGIKPNPPRKKAKKAK